MYKRKTYKKKHKPPKPRGTWPDGSKYYTKRQIQALARKMRRLGM